MSEKMKDDVAAIIIIALMTLAIMAGMVNG